jgi:predicted anti-sigma-YlaC factor YlaD
MGGPPVGCEAMREAISALADGESVEIGEEIVEAHLSGCPSCADFRESIASQRRRMALGPAPSMPDLGPGIASAVAASERRTGWNLPRLGLLLVGLAVVGLSVPGLFLGEDGAAPSHEARHLGAFSMAYGIALLVIVYRPSRARAFLIVTMLLALSLFITAIFDVAQGTIPLAGEMIHIPEVVSLLLVWLLARRPPGTMAGPDHARR